MDNKFYMNKYHQPDPNNTWIRNPFSYDIEKIKNILNSKKLIDF
jgi:hypothetical protein